MSEEEDAEVDNVEDEEVEEDQTLYVYKIPLDRSGGTTSSTYSTSSKGETLLNKYGSNNRVVVKTESTPHFHKDNVGVEVQEFEVSSEEEIEEVLEQVS